MATRMQQRRGTAAEWISADPVLGEGEIGFETDTGKFKIGHDDTVWTELPYFTSIDSLVDGAPDLLNTLNELAAAIGDDPDFITTITSRGLEDLSNVGYYDSPAAEDGDVLSFNASENAWAPVKGLINVELTSVQANDTVLYDSENEVWVNRPSFALDQEGNIELEHFGNIVAEATEDWQTLGAIESYVTSNYALLDDVSILTVKTTVDWAADTSTPLAGSLNVELGSGLKLKIGNGVDDFSDLEYVPTIASVDAQISAGIADKADKAGPTFTGTVVLPATTSIGDVSSTEIGYLDNVTSSIQTQLNDLGTNKANLASPTFTGTVAGITSSMVGLGNVDNTSDTAKPVSTAQQTALDAKLNLAGGTMTGKITLDGDPTQALHAVTKQYVDSVEAGLVTRPQVRAATTANLADVTYANGTAGVGATITADANGAFPLIDGVQLTTVNGNRGLLVKNQTNAAHNGRYNLTTQGTESTPWVLTRCGLCDEADEIPGSYIFVTDGTVNGQTGWVQHVDDPATFAVGTDDIDVYQFAGAGSITAGTNISVSGSQVSVVDAPVFTGIVDASASGVEFSDGVQTQVGVASLTAFSEKTASYTLDTLAHKDNVVEMNVSEAATFTVPTNATLAWPIGGSMDIFATGSGEVTIAAAEGVTLRFTPGLKLRTQWSSATILKKSTDTWFVYGDLKS
jgi:hypothetical protein